MASPNFCHLNSRGKKNKKEEEEAPPHGHAQWNQQKRGRGETNKTIDCEKAC